MCCADLVLPLSCISWSHYSQILSRESSFRGTRVCLEMPSGSCRSDDLDQNQQLVMVVQRRAGTCERVRTLSGELLRTGGVLCAVAG